MKVESNFQSYNFIIGGESIQNIHKKLNIERNQNSFTHENKRIHEMAGIIIDEKI